MNITKKPAIIFLGLLLVFSFVTTGYAQQVNPLYPNMLIQPNGGDILYDFEKYQVGWATDKLALYDRVEIWLTQRTGVGVRDVKKIDEALNYSAWHPWFVPLNFPEGTTYRISLRDKKGNILDESLFEFSVLKGLGDRYFYFISPTQNQIFTTDSNPIISFRRNQKPSQVTFKVTNSAGEAVLDRTFVGSAIFDFLNPVRSAQSTKDFTMHIDWPTQGLPTGNYTITVTVNNTDSISQQVILSNPAISIASPQGGERLRNNQAYTITWNAGNIDKVTIALTSPELTRSFDIASDIDASLGNYDWTIPGDLAKGSNYQIKIFTDNLSEVASTPSFSIGAQPRLIRTGSSQKVYEIVDGKKHWIPNSDILTAYGYNINDVRIVSKPELDSYPRAKLLRVAGDPRVFYLTESGLVRHVLNERVFFSYGNRWEDVITITPDELAAYPSSVLVKAQNDYKVYKVTSGTKHWITTPVALTNIGLDASLIAPVNTTEINAYPTGQEIR